MPAQSNARNVHIECFTDKTVSWYDGHKRAIAETGIGIEKVFHQFKSKMEERKSWASSEEAKQAHGVFECLAHNLALLFELEIKERENLTDEVETEKQEKREPHLKNREGETMKSGGNFPG